VRFSLIGGLRRAATLAGIASALSIASAGAQSVRGRVVDELGFPVAHADVQALPSGTAVLTDTAGNFDLGPLPRGVDSIRIRRVGFEPMIARVIVPLRTPRLTIELRHSIVILDTVHASALEQRLPRLFLRESQHLGSALYGPALDSMFARGGSRSLADELLIDRRFSNTLRNTANGPLCIYVDGHQVHGFLQNYIKENEVSAIEVFDSDQFVHEPFTDGNRIPPLGVAKGMTYDVCGRLVLVWSKYYQQPHWAGH